MILSVILEGDKKQLPVDGSFDDVISSSPFNLRLLWDLAWLMQFSLSVKISIWSSNFSGTLTYLFHETGYSAFLLYISQAVLESVLYFSSDSAFSNTYTRTQPRQAVKTFSKIIGVRTKTIFLQTVYDQKKVTSVS